MFQPTNLEQHTKRLHDRVSRSRGVAKRLKPFKPEQWVTYTSRAIRNNAAKEAQEDLKVLDNLGNNVLHGTVKPASRQERGMAKIMVLMSKVTVS